MSIINGKWRLNKQVEVHMSVCGETFMCPLSTLLTSFSYFSSTIPSYPLSLAFQSQSSTPNMLPLMSQHQSLANSSQYAQPSYQQPRESRQLLLDK